MKQHTSEHLWEKAVNGGLYMLDNNTTPYAWENDTFHDIDLERNYISVTALMIGV